MLNLHEVRTSPDYWASFEDFARRPIPEFQRRWFDAVANQTERAATLIRELESSAASVWRAGPRAGLRITREEIYLLRASMSPNQYMTVFGPEGAMLNFRGIPLHVIDDPLRFR